MTYKYVETKNEVNELINSSAITMIGLIEGEDGDLAFRNHLDEYLDDKTIYITKGALINELYGSDLPEDLRIVSLKYSKLGKLAFIRLQIGAKWFDDFIDNLRS